MECELRRLLRRCAESSVVEDVQILPHGARRGPWIELLGRPVANGARVLRVGVGADDARVHSEVLAADEALGDAARDNALEQPADEVAVAETAVTVLREGGVVGDGIRQVEPAEPATGEVQLDRVAEPPLRADTHDIADEQHPDHQLRVNRGPADGAVERRQIMPDTRQIDEAIHPPQQMVGWHMRLERELVEQRALRNLPRPHHHTPSADPFKEVNQPSNDCATAPFSTQSAQCRPPQILLHTCRTRGELPSAHSIPQRSKRSGCWFKERRNVGRAGCRLHRELHRALGGKGEHVAHEISVSGLLHQLDQRRPAIGHRRLRLDFRSRNPNLLQRSTSAANETGGRGALATPEAQRAAGPDSTCGQSKASFGANRDAGQCWSLSRPGWRRTTGANSRLGLLATGSPCK